MSKLSFRARALDTNKPMPIIRVEDVPGLPDFAAINRAVPQMPTGMEKEEECEHHLQRAISAQQAFGRSVDHVIPTPEVFFVEDDEYDALYPPTVKIPRQLIHVQLPSIEQDQPEYDMDTDDEEWLSKHLNISQTKFEEMIDCLEKSCGLKKVIELSEAKSLLKGDESVMISVYDYWLDKKLNFCRSLIPVVKTERDGTATNSSYVAFRRRTEKMQTRKNRKNDETSYEKMLKLKRDFTAVRDLMQMVTKRELMKLDLLKYVVNIFDSRYKLGDYNGQIYNEIMAARIAKEQALVSTQAREKARLPKNDETVQTRRKRDYKKRPRNTLPQKSVNDSGEYFSSEGETTNDIIYQGVHIAEPEENDDDPDGKFAFKRKKGCNYHAPLDRLPLWPFESDESVLPEKKFRFNLTSLSRPPNHCIGLARRRIGRGGRMIYDRIQSKYDPYLKDLSLDITETDKAHEISEPDLLHFKPPSPLFIEDPQQEVFDFNSQTFFDEEELPNDSLLCNLNEGRLHKNNVYKYQESEICNFLERTNSVVCNSQHSLENMTSQPKSSFKSSFSKSKLLKSNFQITNLCDTTILDSFKTELNCNSSNEITVNADNYDFKSTNPYEEVDSNDAFANFLRSNNLDRLQTSKLEKKSRLSYEISPTNIVNNNCSDYLNSSDNAAFSHGPSTTILNESQSSSNTTIDTKANVVSSQNSAAISSNFSSHCKIKLSNSQNNLHPTDVT